MVHMTGATIRRIKGSHRFGRGGGGHASSACRHLLHPLSACGRERALEKIETGSIYTQS